MSDQFISSFTYVGSAIKNFQLHNTLNRITDNQDIQRELKVSHQLGQINHVVEEKLLFGTVTLFIEVHMSCEEREYNISLEIEGGFCIPDQMEETLFQKMLLNNGIASLFSIARGFIQSTPAQTLLEGSVLLPMFNVAAYSKAVEEEEAEHPIAAEE